MREVFKSGIKKKQGAMGCYLIDLGLTCEGSIIQRLRRRQIIKIFMQPTGNCFILLHISCNASAALLPFPTLCVRHSEMREGEGEKVLSQLLGLETKN